MVQDGDVFGGEGSAVGPHQEPRAARKALRKAELDVIRARVREEHGDDVEAFLKAVFEHDSSHESDADERE